MTITDNDFDALLRTRHYTPEASNLAWRIAVRARHTAQYPENESVFKAIKRLFSELKLPQPAYAIPLVLVIGFALGLFTGMDTTDTTSQVAMLENFFYAENFVL